MAELGALLPMMDGAEHLFRRSPFAPIHARFGSLPAVQIIQTAIECRIIEALVLRKR